MDYMTPLSEKYTLGFTLSVAYWNGLCQSLLMLGIRICENMTQSMDGAFPEMLDCIPKSDPGIDLKGRMPYVITVKLITVPMCDAVRGSLH